MLSEQIEILRRIAETGLAFAQSDALIPEFDTGGDYVDLFQHLIDEIQNTKTAYEAQYTCLICGMTGSYTDKPKISLRSRG